MSRFSYSFPVIDVEMTGKQIKKECRKKGLTVKQVQQFLGIGAFQTVYNWFNGKALPSLDHMLALSRLLKISIEQMLICRRELCGSGPIVFPEYFVMRVVLYGEQMAKKTA